MAIYETQTRVEHKTRLQPDGATWMAMVCGQEMESWLYYMLLIYLVQPTLILSLVLLSLSIVCN